MTWVRSRHVFRWGVEYHDVYENSFDNFFQRAALTFTPFSGNGAQAANIDGGGGIGSQTLQDMIWTLVGGVDTQTQTQFFDKTGKRGEQGFARLSPEGVAPFRTGHMEDDAEFHIYVWPSVAIQRSAV